MKRIVVICFLLITLDYMAIAGENSVMSSYIRGYIKPGDCKVFDDTIDFDFHVVSSIDVSVLGTDAAYVSVSLNSWLQDTIKGIVKTNITVKVSNNAPTRQLWFNLYYLIHFPNGTNKNIFAWMVSTSAASMNSYSQNEIFAYPNPTDGRLRINGLPRNQTINVSVFDRNGKHVLEQSGSDFNDVIDLTGYPEGMYIITLDGNSDSGLKIFKK
jgi:hypothetical protein